MIIEWIEDQESTTRGSANNSKLKAANGLIIRIDNYRVGLVKALSLQAHMC